MRAQGAPPETAAVETFFSQLSDQPWAQAEAKFIEGMWSDSTGDFARSIKAYERARELYIAAGAPKKSLRSELNSVAASTRFPPRRFLAPRYLQILYSAQALGERDLEAQCESLLSRAFQRLGCLSIARVHAERALALSGEAFGSLQRQRFEAHLALLLIELNQMANAETWIESLQISEHSEMRTISKLLSAAASGSKSLPEEVWSTLSPSWRERWLERRAKDWMTTDMEGQLISALSAQPRTLGDLQALLYPELKSDEAAQFRTREILRRVRKRWPELILRVETHYSLNPEFELPPLPKEES
jgi:hypothetical protein